MKECWYGGAGFAFKNGWAAAAGSSLGAGSEGVKMAIIRSLPSVSVHKAFVVHNRKNA